MSSGSFIPDVWAQKMLESMSSYDRAVWGPDEYRRKGHSETHERSPEWLAEREQFARVFEAMVNDGTEKGFLDRDHCYECGGELTVTTSTSETEWVYDESDAEYEARLAGLPPVRLLYGWAQDGWGE